MTSDLDRLRALRALRERRAEAAAAGARARAAAAAAAEARARNAIRAHDEAEAARDAMAHDALLSRGFSHADLLEAEARAQHAAQGRDGLTRGLAEAAAAFTHAHEQQREAEDVLHRAARRHAAIGTLADRTDAAARRRTEALSDTESEDDAAR
ncbi:hypothetical protein [Falsirhodobacter sp. 20TX0035]|uniref:hypothetical protein n=1 Tax=Falsirhodobacter sp. 20TX0035 TaxID=3022019 RepID=UPI00232EE27E|nr:hypothetical protein [Falsirhodobacter sp. 20TX0035]MDB6454400.1 hypothetical protein [Falsirhodobacter sp. 20TX0035]